MPLISVLFIYMGPLYPCEVLYFGLYSCKSFYRRLIKNSYAFNGFLYVGSNFHLFILEKDCKALKMQTKHECFFCLKKVIEEAIIVV